LKRLTPLGDILGILDGDAFGSMDASQGQKHKVLKIEIESWRAVEPCGSSFQSHVSNQGYRLETSVSAQPESTQPANWQL
jgi:hypothetical protein